MGSPFGCTSRTRSGVKPTRDLNQQEIDQLEALIDTTGLSSVLMALSSICGGKAEHIAVNWQDSALAKDWATAGGRIGVIVPSIAARNL